MLRIQDDIKCDLIKNVSFSEKLYIWAAEQEKKDIESVLGKEVNIYINKNKPDDKICYIDTTEQNPLGKKQVNYMLCKQVFTKDMLKSIYLSKQELAKSA